MSYDFSDTFRLEPEETDDLNDSIERAISSAKVCVNNEDFKKYRIELAKAEEKMVKSMISFTNGFMSSINGDMSFYGAKMCRMITKLSDLRSLLDAVEVDIRKEKKENA